MTIMMMFMAGIITNGCYCCYFGWRWLWRPRKLQRLVLGPYSIALERESQPAKESHRLGFKVAVGWLLSLS